MKTAKDWRTFAPIRAGATTNAFKYKAFISYSWADRRWGEWLHHALETYRAPKGVADGRALQPVFKDREEEAAGASIGAAIETALAASEFLVVICSPNSATSKWVNHEVAWFKTHRDPTKILTLIVDGEPLASQTPGREAEECFPRTLLYRVGADFLPTAEFEAAPLAADAREAGDGKRGAKLKLAAAMLGVGYDALARRDNKRRTARRRLVYAGLGSLSVVLGGLSVFAFTQRDAAVAARKVAEAAEKDAKFQAEEAQGLVEFMVTDFRQVLDSLGRLDVLERTGQKLLKFFGDQDVAKLDANALGRRARVQLLLGEVDNTRGNLDAALARYKEASATTEELLKRNPGSAQQIFDHAQSVFWVGYIAWQRGDVVLAKKQFLQYKDYADQLVAIDPEKDEWRMEVGYAVNNLGILAMEQGEAADAERNFSQFYDISKMLLEKNPDDEIRINALRESYSWLASANERLGVLERSEAWLQAELELLKSLLLSDPANAAANERMQVNARMRARVALSRGDRATALSILSDLIDEQLKILSNDSTNATWLDYYCGAQLDLGNTLLSMRRLVDAKIASTKAMEIAAHLRATDKSVESWKMYNQVGALQLAARISLADKDGDAALAMINEIESLLESENSRTASLSKRMRFGENEALKARAMIAANDRIGAKNAAQRAQAILEPIGAKLGPTQQRILVEAYVLGDQPSKAARLAGKLHGAGYRHPDFMAVLEEFPELKPAAESAAAAQ